MHYAKLWASSCGRLQLEQKLNKNVLFLFYFSCKQPKARKGQEVAPKNKVLHPPQI